MLNTEFIICPNKTKQKFVICKAVSKKSDMNERRGILDCCVVKPGHIHRRGKKRKLGRSVQIRPNFRKHERENCQILGHISSIVFASPTLSCQRSNISISNKAVNMIGMYNVPRLWNWLRTFDFSFSFFFLLELPGSFCYMLEKQKKKKKIDISGLDFEFECLCNILFFVFLFFYIDINIWTGLHVQCSFQIFRHKWYNKDLTEISYAIM